jgi:hypothetical protein
MMLNAEVLSRTDIEIDLFEHVPYPQLREEIACDLAVSFWSPKCYLVMAAKE